MVNNPIRLALLGAGLFAQGAHVPALLELTDDFEVVAVCSRTEKSAAAVAAMFPHPVDVVTDTDALLARDDIAAVNIVLPIALLPDAVEQALQAGKHVISEKPVSPDVAVGRKLLNTYNQTNGLVWQVAENFRYENAHIKAAEIVQRGDIGKPVTCQWMHYAHLNPDNPYYQTSWRRDGSFPGGYLLDAGVHFIATLRLILGEIASVSAKVVSTRADLPPVDTLSAALHFDNGAVGSYLASFAVGAPFDQHLHIVGDKGALRMDRNWVEVTVGADTMRYNVAGSQGVRRELAAFAAEIRGEAMGINTPQQALQDVAIMEAFFRSSESGQSVAPERIV